jgi:hypothetical protein
MMTDDEGWDAIHGTTAPSGTDIDAAALEIASLIDDCSPTQRKAKIQVMAHNNLAMAGDIERLRSALEDIQREAMTFKPPRPSWYYDRAQNALANKNEPLVRDGLA